MSREKGLITSAFGRHYQLELPSGERLLAHPRGKKSQAIIGDWVEWAPSQDEAVIEKILPRKNLFYRQDEMRSKAFAANIDQILLMFAAEPEFSQNQLNRTLIAAEAEGIEVIVVMNKSDLATPFEKAMQRLAPYTAVGYKVIPTSMQTQENLETIKTLMHEKVTLVLGPSGAGKSTFINTIIPDAQVQTQELSKALKTGRHTTTTSQLYWLNQSAGKGLTNAMHQGAVIDSPGFQEFGLHHIEPTKVASLMPDFKSYREQCRFHNCTHLHEPGCAVIAAVSTGKIHHARYTFYQNLMQELTSIAPRY